MASLKVRGRDERVRLEVGENGTAEFRRREIRDPKEIRRPKTEGVPGIQVHDEGRWELNLRWD
jgi:hypothetical protein